MAAVCAFLVAAVMLAQEWLLTQIPAGTTFDQKVAIQVSPLNMVRAWAVFLSMFCVIVAYWGVAARKLPNAPRRAGLGFAFCFLFGVLELSYRSIDLFAVNGRWIPRYLEEADPATRAMLRGQIEAFGDVIVALYAVLLAAHMIGSIAYGAATWGGKGLEKWLGVLFAINAGRLALRLLEGYGGQAWLRGTNRTIYAPIVVALFAVVGVWLWKGAYGDRIEEAS